MEGPNTTQVKVLEFDDVLEDKPNAEGKFLLTLNRSPLAFGKTVHVAALAVLDTYGVDGYYEQWQYKYPEIIGAERRFTSA
jgi:hypothetical protein